MKINNQDGEKLKKKKESRLGESIKGIAGWAESESMSQRVVIDQNQSIKAVRQGRAAGNPDAHDGQTYCIISGSSSTRALLFSHPEGFYFSNSSNLKDL